MMSCPFYKERGPRRSAFEGSRPPTGKSFHFRSYPVANQGTESDDCKRMNASASDAMESAAKSV